MHFTDIFTSCSYIFTYFFVGLLAISGQVISGEVYAWVAVFILPINSALNPFLYSFANLRKKVMFGNVKYIKKKINALSKRIIHAFS